MDRIARRLRPVFFWACAAALPIFLLTYLTMLVDWYETKPGWLFAVMCFAHVIVWIAAGMLHDHQKERRQSPQRDR